MMISPGVFFHFSKILIFRFGRGWGGGGGVYVKEQKMAHIDKKCCPSHFVFRAGIDNWDESWVS